MKEIKFHGLTLSESKELIPNNTILLGYRGSIAHGMYRDPIYDGRIT